MPLLKQLKQLFCSHEYKVICSKALSKKGNVVKLHHYLKCPKCGKRHLVHYSTNNRIKFVVTEVEESGVINVESLWLEGIVNTTNFTGRII